MKAGGWFAARSRLMMWWLVVMLVMCSCTKIDPAAEQPSAASEASDASGNSVTDVVIVHRRDIHEFPAARLDGELADVGGCLGIVTGGVAHVGLWPSSLTNTRFVDPPFNDSGGGSYRLGDLVSVVGGEYQSSELAFALTLVADPAPPPACLEHPLWLVATVEHGTAPAS